MLKRGLKNNEIQFYFNRQDRSVNSGRITQIKNNDYGPASLRAVSDQELADFMAAFKPADVGTTIIAQSSPLAPPSKAEIARSLFEKASENGASKMAKRTSTSASRILIRRSCRPSFAPSAPCRTIGAASCFWAYPTQIVVRQA